MCTFGLLHGQFITDLFLVGGEMLQRFPKELSLPQHLILIKQQLAVLVIHFIRGRLKKTHMNIYIKKQFYLEINTPQIPWYYYTVAIHSACQRSASGCARNQWEEVGVLSWTP